jgi:hypothetical protein
MENNIKEQTPDETIKGCAFVIVAIAFISLFIWIKCSPDDPVNNKEKETSIVSDKKKNDSIKLPIVAGVDGLKLLFNEFAKQSKFPYKIKKTPSDTGSTFSYMFTKHLGLVGFFNEDKSLTSLVMITDGKENAANILLSYAALIYVTNPTLLPEDRGDILKELGIIGSEDLMSLNTHTIKGNIKYFATSNQTMGLWFGAEKVNQSVE